MPSFGVGFYEVMVHYLWLQKYLSFYTYIILATFVKRANKEVIAVFQDLIFSQIEQERHTNVSMFYLDLLFIATKLLNQIFDSASNVWLLN